MTPDAIMYVMEKLGGDGDYRRSGDHIMCNCPMSPWTHDHEDRTRKLGVLVQQGRAPLNCFYPGCEGYTKTLYGITEAVMGRKVHDGQATLEDMGELLAFIMLAEEDDVPDAFFLGGKPSGEMPKEILDCLGTGSPYWRSRGVSPAAEALWQVGEVGGRAWIPLIDRKGEVVGAQGRLLPGHANDAMSYDHVAHDEKYRTEPPRFQRETYLHGAHLVKGTVDFLLVLESLGDPMQVTEWIARHPEVLPFGEFTEGFAVISTIGTKVSKQQMQMIVELLSLSGELAIGFDTDNAGRLGTRQLVDAMRRRVRIITEVSWVRKDPTDDGDGEASLEQLELEAIGALKARQDWLLKRIGAQA
jgi:hypothetical protein